MAALARSMCDRKFGAGADGLLLVEKSRSADFKMRIFNAKARSGDVRERVQVFCFILQQAQNRIYPI